jgi:hypothetical protein
MAIIRSSSKNILKHDQFQVITSRFGSIDEQRFINCCLIDHWQRVEFKGEEYYNVNIERYADRCNIPINRAYTELKTYVNKFTEELSIVLITGETWVTRLIYDYKFDDSLQTLSVRFNKELIPFISGDMTGQNYATYDERMDSIPSNKRYVMGELIQKKLHLLPKEGKFIYSIPELRHGLNLKSTEYKVYSALYKRVIGEALKDIANILGEYILAKKSGMYVVFTRVSREVFYENV